MRTADISSGNVLLSLTTFGLLRLLQNFFDAFGDLRRLAYGYFDTLLQVGSGEKTRAVPIHQFFASATKFASANIFSKPWRNNSTVCLGTPGAVAKGRSKSVYAAMWAARDLLRLRVSLEP